MRSLRAEHPAEPTPTRGAPAPLRGRYGRALRRPVVWWTVVGLLAASAAAAMHGLARDAVAARDRYGNAVEVVVVQRTVTAGSLIGADDVRWEQRPIAVVPDGAATALPIGRAARVDLASGEVLLASRVAGAGVTGAAAMVPDGWRAVAIPTTGATLPALAPGDHVDVLVTLVAGDGDWSGAPATVAVDDALVVASDDDRVTVAMPADRAPRIAFALAVGYVTLALRG